MSDEILYFIGIYIVATCVVLEILRFLCVFQLYELGIINYFELFLIILFMYLITIQSLDPNIGEKFRHLIIDYIV